VVILSTHIVDDVSDLCPVMAIISGGRIVRQGAPAALIAALTGRIWTKTLCRGELATVESAHEVISRRLYAGQTVVHVLADQDPGEGFVPAAGGLEDVYLSTLVAARRAA
jgi:ABC-type multidrug transport system ATPase subunit